MRKSLYYDVSITVKPNFKFPGGINYRGREETALKPQEEFGFWYLFPLGVLIKKSGRLKIMSQKFKKIRKNF